MSLLNYFKRDNVGKNTTSSSPSIATHKSDSKVVQNISDLNNENPSQPKLKKYFQKTYNEGGKEKVRDFQSTWYHNYPWLEFSVQSKAAFCFPCRTFQKNGPKNCYEYDSTFTEKGFSNWKSALEKGKGFRKHEESVTHKQAMVLWEEKQRRLESHSSVSTLVCDEVLQKHQYYFSSLVDILQFLVVNELPLRGDKNETFSKIVDASDCDGLFLRLFQYTLMKDSKLADILPLIPKNASYTSSQMQNEIINEMCEMVVQQIADDVKNCDISFFTIKADGARDKSWKENISIVVRYVKNGSVHENLVAILDAKEFHAEYLSDLILNALTTLGLDPKKILSQCYDGAAVMAGCHGGVQAKIQEKLGKRIPYTHCFNHQLHLVVVHAVSNEPKVKTVFDICDSFYHFVRRPNVTQAYEGKLPRRLLPQRWTGHLQQLEIMTNELQTIEEILEFFSESENFSTEVCIEAAGILKQVKKASFRFIAFAMKEILQHLSPANQQLQNEKCDLLSGTALIDSSVKAVKQMRNDDTFQKLLSKSGADSLCQNEERPTKRPCLMNRK